jgi:hypothetical protein
MRSSDSLYFVRRAADELRCAEAAATSAAAAAHYEMAQAYVDRAGLTGMIATQRRSTPEQPTVRQR